MSDPFEPLGGKQMLKMLWRAKNFKTRNIIRSGGLKFEIKLKIKNMSFVYFDMVRENSYHFNLSTHYWNSEHYGVTIIRKYPVRFTPDWFRWAFTGFSFKNNLLYDSAWVPGCPKNNREELSEKVEKLVGMPLNPWK
jgi:hypothetical protein